MPENESQQALYTALAMIPPGRVITYGHLARLAGKPGAARWVGRELKLLPSNTRLPWHRVINAAGRISLPSDSSGAEQCERLKAEGVEVRAQRVDLKTYLYDPAR
ncbi:MGMT family protein [Gilvimarinus xylanilyticus]|uniref:MGMT family protein n=1 Tax=Gilvimarinus xylanilyticus TaxID=2944139 RepID=A0A9X2HVN5_9GAMM|nr:MGMT family protein [Gilvimarinus xylanilyticus]MCP8897864.1 MGMT family protein [Gilvimarinus xylanilyticus]